MALEPTEAPRGHGVRDHRERPARGLRASPCWEIKFVEWRKAALRRWGERVARDCGHFKFLHSNEKNKDIRSQVSFVRFLISDVNEGAKKEAEWELQFWHPDCESVAYICMRRAAPRAGPATDAPRAVSNEPTETKSWYIRYYYDAWAEPHCVTLPLMWPIRAAPGATPSPTGNVAAKL